MLIRLLFQIVLWQGLMAILLFVPAGTINWTGAWIFLVETFVVSAVFGLWLARHDPALFKERLRENTFAAPVVKIQKERAHTVITSGPYRYVRHPMYAGMIFYLFCAPLLLGSWWGLLWGWVLLGVFAIRIQIEEVTLRKELPDYNEYAARVRYRLIPRVW